MLRVLSLKGKPPHEALEVLKKEKPDLAGRFIQSKAEAPKALPKLKYERLEEVLGFKKADSTPFETTLLDTIDNLLEVEKKWIAAGEELTLPPGW
ncbi:hypothetical protein DL96DRAFT_1721825 [Flagelloscypha sp. PMI_526]|nr:hypothetical protein DL96DRAFT_1721825 [Flagelloscypha sp. PMI_526]